jgi:HK97 gp10 family phage protein
MARKRKDSLLGKSDKRIPGGGRVVWNDNPFLAEINKKMAPKLRQSANIVANIARDEVPIGQIMRAASQFASWKGRKPGSLLKSIKVVKSKFKDGGYLVKVGGPDTFYWFFVEYGTSNMYPQWFMSKAIRKSRGRLRGIF